MMTISQALRVRDSCHSFDMVVVILSIKSEHINSRCTLIVTDDSISRHESARVFLHKVNTKDSEKLREIQACDIVRFNSVCINKVYKTLECNDSSDKISNMSIICDIKDTRQFDRHSLTFVKLGTCTKLSGGNILVEPNLSPDMKVSKDRIFKIACHFEEHHSRYFTKNTEIILCEDRKIREVRISDILSNVAVKITQLGMEELPSLNHNRQLVRVILSDAMGIQDEEDFIPLYIENNHHLLEELKRSFRDQSCIVIHNVLTKKRDGDRWIHIHGFFLVPTPNSSVSEFKDMKNPKRARLDVSQSLNTMKSSLSFPYSFSFNTSVSNSQVLLNGYISLIQIIGSDIFLGNEFPWPESTNLGKYLIEKNSYKHAIITLAIPESLSSTKVYASSKVMNILCGSFDAALSNEPSNIEMISKLLHGLISLKVPLLWTIGEHLDEVQHIPIVEEVDLKSMDF